LIGPHAAFPLSSGTNPKALSFLRKALDLASKAHNVSLGTFSSARKAKRFVREALKLARRYPSIAKEVSMPVGHGRETESQGTHLSR